MVNMLPMGDELFSAAVLGLAPVSQGSKGVTRTGQVYESNNGFVPYRRALVDAFTGARDTYDITEPLDGPLVAVLTFQLVRPKSVPRSRVYPSVKPDGDKLERAVFDALTLAKVWRDDGRCVESTWRKRYTPHLDHRGEQMPGVLVVLYRA